MNIENPLRVIWKCGYCDDVLISYSHLRHDMNTCDCGKSALDLEEHYCRTIGKVNRISTKERKEGKWVKL